MKLARYDLKELKIVHRPTARATVITAVLGALQQALTAHGFDVGACDWESILDVAGTAFPAYLSKNLFSTEDWKVLGVIG